MKKNYVIILLTLLTAIINLHVCAQSFNNNITVNKSISENIVIRPFSRNANITGIAISGHVEFNSDTSFVRIIVNNGNNEAYLIYETYPMLTDEKSFDFSFECEESCFLNNYTPSLVEIQVSDATLTLDDILWNDKPYKNAGALNLNKRLEKNQLKMQAIQDYIAKNGLLWTAGETPVSQLPYSKKSGMWGNNYMSFGREYYSGGIYSVSGPKAENNYSKFHNFVDNFDWRSRHGANNPGSPYYDGDPNGSGWMNTPVCQSGCWYNNELLCNISQENCENMGGEYRVAESCWAFGPTSQIEGLVNLYYNKHINIDLSEQFIVCKKNYDSTVIVTGDPENAYNLYKNTGVPEESWLPYSASMDNCTGIEDNNDPDERIWISDYSAYYNLTGHDTIKKLLVQKGPLTTADAFLPWGRDNHSKTIVGWGTIDESTSSSITGLPGVIDPQWYGYTYWIYRDSKADTHFYYETNNRPPWGLYSVDTPLRSLKRNESDINCYDKDGDGYYSWGIGPKPAHCPECPDEPDGDDFNPSLGPVNEYGQCTIIDRYNANFETGWDGWIQINSDDGDWLRHSGPVVNPPCTIQGAQDGNFYIYNPSNGPNDYPHKNFIIESPPINLSKHSCESKIDFYYHMNTYLWGHGNGKLEFQVSYDGGMTWVNNYWYKDQDQGIGWKHAVVYFPSSVNKVRFIAKTGGGIWSNMALDNITIEPVKKETEAMVISSDRIWNYDENIYSDIIVNNGVTFTITGQISLFNNVKITVKPGAKLIVDGGVLTTGICPSDRWQGILVEGGNGSQNYSTHGCVEVKNGAIIENAARAIESKNGGIVRLNNAVLKNNIYGIYFDQYPSAHSMTQVRYSTFVTDKMFDSNNSKYPMAHIYLKGVKGLMIYGNTFKNEISFMPAVTGRRPYYVELRGIGIRSVESSFSTSMLTVGIPSSGTGNGFRGLYYGIHSGGQNGSGVDIRYNNFDDNFRGVYVSGGNGTRVIYNNINTLTASVQVESISASPEGLPGSAVKYGAYLASCTNFKMEENKIRKGNAGLYVYNLGDANGYQIYRNDFGISGYSTTSGTLIVGKNSNYVKGDPDRTGQTGLQIRCNKYTNNNTAVGILNGNMRRNQGDAGGSTDKLAGNQFHKTYANSKEFTVQIDRSSLIMYDYSRFDLGTYNYYQHDDRNAPADDNFYRQLRSSGNNNVNTYTSDGNQFREFRSCPSSFSSGGVGTDPGTGGGVIIQNSINDISGLNDNLEVMGTEYSLIVDKSDTGLMLHTAEGMDGSNYTESYNKLSNSGYLSDVVYSAVISNSRAPEAAKAAVLINNSPMPEGNSGELAGSDMDESLKALVMEYQAGLNPRVNMEFRMSDIKQEIYRIESDMINNVINNEGLQDEKTVLLSYMASKDIKDHNTYLDIYRLQLSMDDYLSAGGTLQQLSSLPANITAELAEEIEAYCTINNIYLNSLDGGCVDTSVLSLHREELLDAALSGSWLYSEQAKTLYSYISDTLFAEYTPLPGDIVQPRKQEEKYNTAGLFNPELTVYPNPTKGQLHIEYDFGRNYGPGYELLFEAMGKKYNESCSKGMLNVYNMEGKKLFTLELTEERGTEAINISSFPAGTYILEVTDCYGNLASAKINKQ